MKHIIEITTEWWNNENPKLEIKTSHREVLEEEGINRVVEMMKDGYTSGELNHNLCLDRNDPDEGIDYSGFWSLRTKTKA
jgi:hypothetical protein